MLFNNFNSEFGGVRYNENEDGQSEFRLFLPPSIGWVESQS